MIFPTGKVFVQLYTSIHESWTVKSTFSALKTASVLGGDAHIARKKSYITSRHNKFNGKYTSGKNMDDRRDLLV